MADRGRITHARLMCGAAMLALLSSGSVAVAQENAKFNIAPQPLASALNEFAVQSPWPILYTSQMTGGKTTAGVNGETNPELALNTLLAGTGLTYRRNGDTFLIVSASDPQSGSAAGDGADGTVQALIVTAQKREENIQDVPIAMSAFTQEALERSQVAGGPDLMTQVPNMTFTKTNFTSYSIQIRGVGTQAISATTDAAVAVAFNNTPFIRNRFFEQEFYDLQRVEVLRGPQGTLYGRNATAGVVNLISQKPKFTYEAKVSADVSNYSSTRLEGMLNIPLVDDKVAIRLAGAWTKRDGFTTNQITGNPIDGRDLWSTRLSLRVTPTDKIDATLIWEHFEENDDRLRSGKQLCHQDDRTEYAGYRIAPTTGYSNIFSQGCLPASMYSPDSFEAPNGYSLPYYLPLFALSLPINPNIDPYASLVQSRDLRVIESTFDPKYKANSDVVELQASIDLTDHLTLTSESAYSFDRLFSFEDFNRFNTSRGAFVVPTETGGDNTLERPGVVTPGPFGGIFCDPQLGCADRVVAGDVSTARSRQFSQELRVSSDFEGPFNFSLGTNFLRYDTEDKYYVFINTISMVAANYGYWVAHHDVLGPYIPGVSDNHECLVEGGKLPDPTKSALLSGCIYMDPNPIGNLNDLGHNYFLSRNPYKLISYAVFGEAYYNITDNLKLTAGLRWTVDKKEAPRIPSWLLAADSLGYSVLAVERQEWREPTGRLAIDWKPDLSFTDQTLLYASYAHGYKAGGSNPPPSGTVAWGLNGGAGQQEDPLAIALREQTATKPKTFDPEFVNAYEIGTKNTLLDGKLTLNADAFFYDYTGYQVSQIIDRSAVNYNFDSKIWGLELEADWRPLENLRIGFKGGYEHTRIDNGEQAIDIMERNYGHGPDSADPWIVIRPFPSFPSNCVLPLWTVSTPGDTYLHLGPNEFSTGSMGPCEYAYALNLDPVWRQPYTPNPTSSDPVFGGWVAAGYPGFDPSVDYGNNHGEGFMKPLGGHELPNAPHFTSTITADYTIPLPNDWFATLHTDLYYQSEAWTRVFNTPGYDKLKAFTNVNVAAIFTNDDAGWKVMAYVKNVFDKDNITGAFLNSDDTGLTTNVFLVEPRLYGLRVTKDFSGGPWWTGANPNHTGPYPLTVELGGALLHHDAPYSPIESHGDFPSSVDPARLQNLDMDRGEGGDLKVTYQPSGSPWSVSGAWRWNTAKVINKINKHVEAERRCVIGPPFQDACQAKYDQGTYASVYNWLRGDVTAHDEHHLADFEVGRDVGLGWGVQSKLSGGLRYAEFKANTHLKTLGSPDIDMPDEWSLFKYTHNHIYDTDITMDREFKGAGPTLSWDASKTLWGGEANGKLDLELSLSGGVLFGKQKVKVTGGETSTYYQYILQRDHEAFVPQDVETFAPTAHDRSKSVTVPTYAAALGLSYDVGRFKVGTGYRWERFSHVLDGGYAERKQYDRTLDGPYFKVSIGFGG